VDCCSAFFPRQARQALKPHKNPSRALLPHIDFIKPIRTGALRVSQFPDALADRYGTFTKPAGW
jgi:hypothetical protein